jgi:hypothetical protein
MQLAFLVDAGDDADHALARRLPKPGTLISSCTGLGSKRGQESRIAVSGCLHFRWHFRQMPFILGLSLGILAFCAL